MRKKERRTYVKKLKEKKKEFSIASTAKVTLKGMNTILFMSAASNDLAKKK